MLPDKTLQLLLGVTALAQCVLLLQLVGVVSISIAPSIWLFIHVLLNALSTFCTIKLIAHSDERFNQAYTAFTFVFALSLFIPLIGSVGTFLSMLYSVKTRRRRHKEPDYWQLTPLAPLPYTTPTGRSVTKADGRGFVEHLMYSSDDEDLYRKVLSAENIKTSLSVSALKQAMRHSDEHIRLSAYKTLDRKVTRLNQQIQHLEAQAASDASGETSNTWLQISNNYWELLTLEDADSVARKQLLERAAAAAILAVSVNPDNRNAHYVLGRISLLQGDITRAALAFKRSGSLGMPTDKVLPYLAETAFAEKNYARVTALLRKLGSATKIYPPLSHVVEYWT